MAIKKVEYLVIVEDHDLAQAIKNLLGQSKQSWKFITNYLDETGKKVQTNSEQVNGK